MTFGRLAASAAVSRLIPIRLPDAWCLKDRISRFIVVRTLSLGSVANSVFTWLYWGTRADRPLENQRLSAAVVTENRAENAYTSSLRQNRGDTVEFWFSEKRNLTAAKRFLLKALVRHGRPERIVIDGSQTNREAILSCDTTDQLQDRSRPDLRPIRIRWSADLNNRIEQDHRAIKRRVRPMLGFKSMASARVILSGIEMAHIMRKGQAKSACTHQLSLAEQFGRLAA